MAKRRARARRDKTTKAVAVRNDAWFNEASGVGTHRDRRTHTGFREDIVPDVAATGLWRSDWIIKRVIELAPTDACRPGFGIRISRASGDGKAMAEALMKDVERLELVEKICLMGQYRRAYGGVGALPIIDGAVGSLDEPLEPYMDSIGKVLAVHIFEPRELRPYTWYRDIRHPKFRRPETYMLWPLSSGSGFVTMPSVVHESRLAILNGKQISNQPLPGQRLGWNDGEVACVRAIAADFGMDWGSVSTLLQDFAQGVYSIDGLTDLLATQDGEELARRKMRFIDEMRSVLRSAVIDKNDTFSRITTPVSGLEGLMIQAAQIVAAAAGMPVTKLLGISPAGMNATGEADTRSWYDFCDGERGHYNPALRWFVKLLMLQGDGPCKGTEPEVWSAPWNPLWQPTDKEIAETRKIDSEADTNWYNIGAASADDIARSHWAGDTYSRDISIDWKAREEQAKLMATDPGTTEEVDDTASTTDNPTDAGVEADKRGAPSGGSPKNGGPGNGKTVKVISHERAVG